MYSLLVFNLILLSVNLFLGYYALLFALVINSPPRGIRFYNGNATVIRRNYTSYINIQKRTLHIEQTTFYNSIIKKKVSNHLMATVEVEDLPYLNPKGSVRVGDRYIATSTNYHLKKSGIPHSKVLFKIYGPQDGSKLQYLFKVDPEQTEINKLKSMDNHPHITEIRNNFLKDLEYLSNEEQD